MTEQKCNEVLATTADYDANDGSLTDLIVNCKINQEIIPRLLGELKTCKEEFPPYGRLVYSCSCQFIQYVLPTITISVALLNIWNHIDLTEFSDWKQTEPEMEFFASSRSNETLPDENFEAKELPKDRKIKG